MALTFFKSSSLTLGLLVFVSPGFKDVSMKLGRRSFGHLNHIKDIKEVQDV